MRWTTWVIPVIVGLVAAGLNFYLLNQKQTSPVKFARVAKGVTAGTQLTDDDLEEVELSGSEEALGKLTRTAVRYEDRGLLKDRIATRDLQKNDLVLWRDFSSARGELRQPALPVSLDGLSLPERLVRVDDRVGFVIARRLPPPASGATPDPDYEEVGPFLVLSVGDLTARRELDSKERAGAGERKSVV